MKKAFPILFASVLLFVSCLHTRSPFQEEYYFQALGEEGEFVVTADLEKMRKGELGTLLPEENKIIDRTERVSLSLLPEDETVYPAGMEDFVLSGALEGDFPKSLSNLALSVSKDFEKVKGSFPKRYSGSGLMVGVPKSGIVIFTNGDYSEFLSRSILEREKKIPDDIALM
ncbi:MAG: hypothetical protein KBS81_01315, partial [Spirochaetales bacterium]|nr:hypothetical protein [Candidatus Physcosoma equi]